VPEVTTPLKSTTLVNLISAWRDNVSFDMRRLSKADRKRAVECGILTRIDGKYEYRREFTAVYDLPTDVLFEILRPALATHSGYSINNAPQWGMPLNVYPESHHLATERDRKEREWALWRLERDGYIDWQIAGSVWRVDICAGH